MVNEEVIAKTALDYLVSQGNSFEASLLLRAWTTLHQSGESGFEYGVKLSVPADMLEFFRNALNDERIGSIRNAYMEALQGLGYPVAPEISVWAALAPSNPYPGWQQAADSALRGDDTPLNQGVVATTSALFTWNGLRFRSRTETVMAAAFGKAGVLFFPLPAAVSGMTKREPDFLVCMEGKWGILEVQGDEYHTPETATKESERRRWFVRQGIKVMEFYNATRCYKDPDGVIREFLSILRSS